MARKARSTVRKARKVNKETFKNYKGRVQQ
jgi:hypothetical protein